MMQLILQALGETLYMMFLSGFLSILFGLPLGILLWMTAKKSIWPKPNVHRMLAMVVNVLRSLPFIILMIALIPLTRLLIGTSIGTNAAIVPLTIGAIPFVARMVEQALAQVSLGLIEAGLAMGASTSQLIWKIVFSEALPSIVGQCTIMLITLLGYSSMAGVVGGGGLGDLAIRYGYQRFDWQIMLITIVILIVLVELIQAIGNLLMKKLSH